MTDPNLPRNVEAEATFIGSCLIDNSVVRDCADRVQPEDFYEPLHGRLFETIRSLVDEGQTVTVITLKPYFESDEAMKALGGIGYLAKLTGDGAGLIGARDFAKQISELAKLRRIIEIADQLRARALDTSESIDPLRIIAETDEDLSEIALIGERDKQPSSFASAFDKTLDDMAAEQRGEIPGGIELNDLRCVTRAIGKLRSGDQIILAGRPGMGKTTTAQRMALCAASQGMGTAFFSLEMDKPDMVRKAITDEAFGTGDGPNYDRMQKGDFTAGERAAIKTVRDRIDQWPLYLDYCPGLTLSALRSKVQRIQRQMERKGYHLALVVVDYIGLMDAQMPRAPKEAQISHLSKSLKIMAGQLGVANLVLSQLSRAVEAREDKRPILSDLRDSGSLEQDADTVFFTYREQYYLEATAPKPGEDNWNEHQSALANCRNDMDIICGKRRHGKISTQKAKFYGAYQAVRDCDWQPPVGTVEMEL
ncbi:DnaB-like helicase C-terminal domain-containing protein [Parasphingorhabdus sp.]|uniref:DnaB-like helicase C-terminal domain-containing protein n=1 Tax=Parasphingorhabdus sp. TaxID=2709688 RepID=UPI003A8D1790